MMVITILWILKLLIFLKKNIKSILYGTNTLFILQDTNLLIKMEILLKNLEDFICINNEKKYLKFFINFLRIQIKKKKFNL